MGIDAGIYGNLKNMAMPDYLDSAQKAASVGSQQLNQAHTMKQMGREDEEAKRTAMLHKASAYGNEIESLSGLTPEARAAAYPQVRAKLIEQVGIDPAQVPEQYDDGLYNTALSRWQRSKEGVENKLKAGSVQLQKSQIAKNYAEAAKEKAGQNGALSRAEGLRKEWTGLPTTKATQDVAQSIERVRNAANNVSPAGDLSLLYGFMKMIDPGSTVRESEFGTAAAAGSVPTQIRAQWEKVMSGQRLTEGQRQDFVNQAEKMYGGQMNAQKTVDSQYGELAGRYGVDPKLVMMKFPDPKELKLAMKQEAKEPGWLAKIFGATSPTSANASPAKPAPVTAASFDGMADADVAAQYTKWKQSQGAQ